VLVGDLWFVPTPDGRWRSSQGAVDDMPPADHIIVRHILEKLAIPDGTLFQIDLADRWHVFHPSSVVIAPRDLGTVAAFFVRLSREKAERNTYDSLLRFARAEKAQAAECASLVNLIDTMFGL
jgi:hypothetical protein